MADDKMTVPQMEAALPTMTGPMARACVAQLEGVVFANRDKDSLDIINAMVSKLRAKLKELGEPVRLKMLGGDSAKFNDTQSMIAVLRGVGDLCRAGGKAELAGNADSLVDFLEAIVADVQVAPPAEPETEQPSKDGEPGPTGPEATPAAVKLAKERGVDLHLVPYNGKHITKADVQTYIDIDSNTKQE